MIITLTAGIFAKQDDLTRTTEGRYSLKILMFEWRVKTKVWIETADDPYVIQYPIMAKKAADILVTSHLLISGWKKLVPFAMIRSKT